MGGLQTLEEAALAVAVERCAEGGELSHRRRAFLSQELGHRRVDQPGAGGDGVVGVERGIVVRRQRRRHAPLRPG
jgi:hypothetical protein